MPLSLVPVDAPADIHAVVDLADEIWREHYTPLIGKEQVAYMLERFQSFEAIAAQVADGCEYVLARTDGRDAGYTAIRPESDGTVFLSKLYVLKELRGQGIGRAMYDHILSRCRACRVETLWLTVNKNNVDAIAAYRALGFVVSAAIVTDIGNGFVMDDYRMELRVAR